MVFIQEIWGDPFMRSMFSTVQKRLVRVVLHIIAKKTFRTNNVLPFSLKKNLRCTISSPCIVRVVLLLPSDSLSGSCRTNDIFRSVWPAMDCRLWADVWEWPIELRAIDHRRLVSLWNNIVSLVWDKDSRRTYRQTLSHGTCFSLVDNLDVLGKVW